ncbi:hypothetical protein CFP65_7605 [Kitasatospora sp. MMS16-BH015]|nr:hypothetical protein CFP65_7605 [Kitasatospora sp. MMS16-BH015]
MLDRSDRRAAAVLWLTVTVRRPHREPLVAALRAGDGPAVRAALLAPGSVPLVGSAVEARRIVEATRLAELLADRPTDPALAAVALRLLVRMGRAGEDGSVLRALPEAAGLYETVIGRAGSLPPDVAQAAALLSLAQDLSSGTGALLPWPPGRREGLLRSLGEAVQRCGAAEPTTESRRRAEWIRRTGRRPFELVGEAGRSGLRVEVVVADPALGGEVEARLLVDGRPVVPEHFGAGPALTPERLLDSAALRATEEPREVVLAEASCAPGCCGELLVTIRREGAEVVWEHLHRTMGRPRPGGPAEYRFSAAAYEAELARAERDRAWSWPARTVARLIAEGLRERPELLAHWELELCWATTSHSDPDTAVLMLGNVGSRAGADYPNRYEWTVPDDGTPAEAQAAAALRRLGEADPRW